MVKDGERKMDSESLHASEVGFGHMFRPEVEHRPERRKRMEKITTTAAGKMDSFMILIDRQRLTHYLES